MDINVHCLLPFSLGILKCGSPVTGLIKVVCLTVRHTLILFPTLHTIKFYFWELELVVLGVLK